MCRIVAQPKHPDLLTGLSKLVDRAELGFPREVCSELEIIAREEPIWAWANGLTSKLDPFAADIVYMRTLMANAVELGFEDGFESLEKGENGFGPVCRLCFHLQAEEREFVLATEDTGETPLRPTMEQIANHVGWTRIDAATALEHLGLADLLT
ncbi:hypothetical protein ACXDF8_23970 [Mycolicibacterium sp. CBM1]